jgi:hypothetical protein|tara:strand:+ start:2096 stop:2485 length:390 start_codon:yes stop_codon:yes gene_type:complete
MTNEAIQNIENLIQRLENAVKVDAFASDENFNIDNNDIIYLKNHLDNVIRTSNKLEKLESQKESMVEFITSSESFQQAVRENNDSFMDLEDKVMELENQVESQPDIYDIEDKIQDVVDAVIDDLRITRG